MSKNGPWDVCRRYVTVTAEADKSQIKLHQRYHCECLTRIRLFKIAQAQEFHLLQASAVNLGASG
jgi:hypothetical protein